MSNKIFILLNIVVLTIFLTFRLPGLGPDISNSDAARWHRRSEAFLQSLKTGNLRATYQHYQPGVTLLWINSIVKELAFKYNLTRTKTPPTLENADWYPIIHGISKEILVLTLSIILLIQIYLISKIFSRETAVIFAALISIEPYMIGIDRWFHLTSLETYLTFTSFLFILFWNINVKKKYLVLSAFTLALATLSKLIALIALPIILLIAIKRLKQLKLSIKRILVTLIIFSLVLTLTFTILMPSMWVSPLWVLQKLISATGNAVTNDLRITQLSPVVSVFFYFLILIAKMSPISLMLLIYYLFKKSEVAYEKTEYLIYYFTYFFIVISIPQKKIDRYVLELIPPIILFISINLCKANVKFQKIVIILIVLFTLYFSNVLYPVFSAYYSPFIGEADGAIKLGIYDNSGEYFAQAAEYLNTKGRNIYTYIPYNYESFSYYYKGNSQRERNYNTNYIVISKDITRKDPISIDTCPKIDKAFGPNKYKVVYVCKTK